MLWYIWHINSILNVFELCKVRTDLEVIKHCSCSIQLSMKSVLLIDLKYQATENYFLLNIVEHDNILANEYENGNYCGYFHIC